MFIVEREVNLESLSHTFILEVFRERTWTPLLIGFGDVCEPLVQEFFSNAVVNACLIDYWVRGTEFTISPASIQNLLQSHIVVLESSLPYDERRTRIAEAVTDLGGRQELSTI